MMNKEDKIKMLANEISDIHDDKVREFAKRMVEEADDYFFVVPASSSGKYHPSFDLGDGGLVRHTRCVVYYSECIAESFEFDSRKRDMIIVAAMAHDIKKQGDGEGKHTVTEHPILAGEYLKKIAAEVPDAFTDEELNIVIQAVRSHMGKWGAKDGLPLPESEFDKCLQVADYIASRKEILDFNFRPTENVSIEKPQVNESTFDGNPGDYVLNFGKHRGKTLREVEPTGYLDWMIGQEEFFNKEAQEMARKYLSQGKATQDAPKEKPVPVTVSVDDDLPF